MNAERLIQLYDRIAEAPDAVSRLRCFVLDLAVRGKLVEQNPEDEPASELLKRVEAGKIRLIKEGQIRKPRDLGNNVDQPFVLPDSWCWCRLDSVGAIVGGGTPSASDAENFAEPGEGIPWLTPADLGGYSDQYISRGARDLSEKGLKGSSATLMPAGSVLFTSRAPIGYVAIARNPISTNQGFKSVVPYLSESSRFIALALKTFAPDIDKKAPGTTFKEVSGKIVAGIPFPLPPLAEQHRIVAKVDELMTLCDRLEETHNTHETTRDRLTTATLTRLTAPDTDNQSFHTHARFALDTLPALTACPDQIKILRQTILDLAVRGKLAEQNPDDEAANISDTELLEIDESLPSKWQYVRLKKLLTEKTRNGYSRRPDGAINGVPILRISAGTARPDGIVAEEEHKLISGIDENIKAKYRLNPGDLLACRFNGNRTFVGRLTLFSDYLGLKPLYPDKLIRVRLNKQVAKPEFIRMIGDSDVVRREVEKFCATTVGNWGISASNLNEVPFPLPPLAEQNRIVAKVDELMVLCDQLEASLTKAETTRNHLLQTMLYEALQAPENEMEAA